MNFSKCKRNQEYDPVTENCSCVEGWIGEQCLTLFNPCGSVPKCLNGGQCVEEVCVCVDNFEGIDCGIAGKGFS